MLLVQRYGHILILRFSDKTINIVIRGHAEGKRWSVDFLSILTSLKRICVLILQLVLDQWWRSFQLCFEDKITKVLPRPIIVVFVKSELVHKYTVIIPKFRVKRAITNQSYCWGFVLICKRGKKRNLRICQVIGVLYVWTHSDLITSWIISTKQTTSLDHISWVIWT